VTVNSALTWHLQTSLLVLCAKAWTWEMGTFVVFFSSSSVLFFHQSVPNINLKKLQTYYKVNFINYYFQVLEFDNSTLQLISLVDE